MNDDDGAGKQSLFLFWLSAGAAAALLLAFWLGFEGLRDLARQTLDVPRTPKRAPGEWWKNHR